MICSGIAEQLHWNHKQSTLVHLPSALVQAASTREAIWALSGQCITKCHASGLPERLPSVHVCLKTDAVHYTTTEKIKPSKRRVFAE